MLVLISGVVLLTHKKPEPPPLAVPNTATAVPILRSGRRPEGTASGDEGAEGAGVTEEFWAIGEDSDEEGDSARPRAKIGSGSGRGPGRGEERLGLIGRVDDGETINASVPRRSGSSDATLSRDHDPFRDEGDEFGEWEDAGVGTAKTGLLR